MSITDIPFFISML